MTPTLFLRFITLASVVAVIYSDGSHHRRHRLDLLLSQQLGTPKTSPNERKLLQNELHGSGGNVKRTGFLVVTEGSASDGEGTTVIEPSDVSRAKENIGQFHQLVGNARRSRRTTAESKASTPAPTKAGTGPLSFPPTTVSSPLAHTATVVGSGEILTPAPTAKPTSTVPPATDAAASATPTPLRETRGATPVPPALLPIMEPSPLGSSPAPTVVPSVTAVPAPTAVLATPRPTKPTLMLESPPPTVVSPTLMATMFPAATPAPTIKPTSTPAEMPTTPPPAMEPTAATEIDHSRSPQTPENEVSPTSPEITPTPTVPPRPVAEADRLSHAGGYDDADKPTAAGGGITDANNASDAGGDQNTDDSIEPQASGSDQATGSDGDDGGGEFVVGAGLDSSEKEKIVVGTSVIGSLAVALVAAAWAAKRYNAMVSGLDDEADYEYGGLPKGRPGRVQTRNALPTYRVSPGISPGSRTMDI
eukprot:g8622.t1